MILDPPELADAMAPALARELGKQLAREYFADWQAGRLDGKWKTTVLTPDEQVVLYRLEDWHARIEQILGMFDDQGVLPRSRLEEARTLYTDLKRGLEEEYRDLSNSRRDPPLNVTERRWYQRTIHQAFVHLRAKTNAAPERWLDSLGEARMDIGRMIFEMKEFERKSGR